MVVINWAMASDLDRVDQHRKNPEWVAQMWRADDAKLLKFDRESRFTTNTGGSKLRMTKPFVEYDSQRHRLLGVLSGSPIFAVEALTEGEVHDFREVAYKLTDNERDICATAAALGHWHRQEPKCSVCGSDTKATNGGFARKCNSCGRENFPRTDPAVIVAVVDAKDRLLLGAQPGWGNRVSVLAGFVEVGESLEQAIHREIGEEADIAIDEVRYFGSQPWPFPRSVMIGFFARAASTAICIAQDELAFADWFTRDDLNAKITAGELALPGKSSIASRLIQTWLDREAPL